MDKRPKIICSNGFWSYEPLEIYQDLNTMMLLTSSGQYSLSRRSLATQELKKDRKETY